MDDEEIQLRAKHLKVDPTTNILYSRWEREERKKPKPKKDDEEEEEEEDPIKPFDEFNLI
jgi:hypothetical protein